MQASERYYTQTWNQVEVTSIAGDDCETQMKRRGANEQIFKGNDDSARRTVALNASGQPRDLGG